MVTLRRLCAVMLCAGSSIAAPRAQTPDAYAQLKFRYIGPVGNRVVADVALMSIVQGSDASISA